MTNLEHCFMAPSEPANTCVVRLTTSYWSDKKGVYKKQAITFMRRRCGGFNLLEEEIGATGAAEAVEKIVNLSDCSDGMYEVMTCNESRDFESGIIDDYDLSLVRVLNGGTGNE